MEYVYIVVLLILQNIRICMYLDTCRAEEVTMLTSQPVS